MVEGWKRERELFEIQPRFVSTHCSTGSSRGWDVQASGELGLVRIFKCWGIRKSSPRIPRTNYRRGESLEREIVATRTFEKAVEIRRSSARKTKERKNIDEVRLADNCDCLSLSPYIETAASIAKMEAEYTEWPAYTPFQILLKNLF